MIILCNGYEQNNHEDVLFKKEVLFNSTKSILIYSRFTYVPMSFVKFWYFKQNSLENFTIYLFHYQNQQISIWIVNI